MATSTVGRALAPSSAKQATATIPCVAKLAGKLKQLRTQIQQAFPPFPFGGLVAACTCNECAEICEHLQHRSWTEVPAAFLDWTCGPALFTPEALHSFIPAYMLRALDDLNGNSAVLEFTVYSLCPLEPTPPNQSSPDREALHRLYVAEARKKMTCEQVQAIRNFLLLAGTHGKNAVWLNRYTRLNLKELWN